MALDFSSLTVILFVHLFPNLSKFLQLQQRLKKTNLQIDFYIYLNTPDLKLMKWKVSK